MGVGVEVTAGVEADSSVFEVSLGLPEPSFNLIDLASTFYPLTDRITVISYIPARLLFFISRGVEKT